MQQGSRPWFNEKTMILETRHWCEKCQAETWCERAEESNSCVCTNCGEHKDGDHV